MGIKPGITEGRRVEEDEKKKKLLHCITNLYTDEMNHPLEIIVSPLTAEVYTWIRPETSISDS